MCYKFKSIGQMFSTETIMSTYDDDTYDRPIK
jgi:hypothetical protein